VNPEIGIEWWASAGIVRDVWRDLLCSMSGPHWIRRQNIRSEMNSTGPLIATRISMQNGRAATEVLQRLLVRVTAYDTDIQRAQTKRKRPFDNRGTLGAGPADYRCVGMVFAHWLPAPTF